MGVPTWEQIARDYGGFLYTVAFRLTGDRHDAADLVQDTLLRVERGLASYQPRSMEGWLSRIATNVFLDEIRRRRRRPAEGRFEEAERTVASSGAVDETLSEPVWSEGVQLALGGLPEDFRLAVVLCDVGGLSYAEIGTALAVPVGTVRSRIHRGRALLREALA